MIKENYDLIVIGAGPGGYVAAIRASQLGMKTAIVEREHLGGICLNWGCIPTKALLRSAEILELTRTAGDFGIEVNSASPNVPAMVERSRQVSAQLNRGVEHLLKKNKVDVIWGEAKLTTATTVSVTAASVAAVEPCHPKPRQVKSYGDYAAKHIIIATGARPRELAGLKPNGEHIITYFDAMKPTAVPESMLIAGSGAIGVEFASFYAALGTTVTIIEKLSNVLPQEDHEIAKFVHNAFNKRGIEILTDTTIGNCECIDKMVKVKLVSESGQTSDRTFEKIVSAVGVVPNVEGLGLETVGVEVSNTGIAINTAGATTCSGIFAIGDVAGPPMLAHKAEHEAIICVEAIASGKAHALDRSRIPSCIYSQPQIASIGLTESGAFEAGHQIRVGRFPFAANGKAVALGETDGFVKTLFDKQTGELLGAHLVGAEVTELIQGFATAMGHETTDEHLLQLVYPHPTLSEALHESTLNALGRTIHY